MEEKKVDIYYLSINILTNHYEDGGKEFRRSIIIHMAW
jgi:hypothetical protein